MTIPPTNQPDPESHPLQTSRYDRVSGWLLAMLVAVGLMVLIMFTMWWHNTSTEDNGGKGGGGNGKVELVLPTEILFSSKNHQLASLDDEAEKADKKAQEEFQQRLKKLEDASAAAGKIDEGLAGKEGDGNAFIPDDRRNPPDNPNDPLLAGERHWEIQFNKTSLETYAKQLDFFKIEFGVLFPDGRVAYVANVSDSRPSVRYVSNPGKKEKRYYFIWRRGELKKADSELLARGGVDASKGIVVKFLPLKLETELEALEKEAAGSETRQIGKTRFGIKPTDGGFAFYVLEQTYKNTPASRT